MWSINTPCPSWTLEHTMRSYRVFYYCIVSAREFLRIAIVTYPVMQRLDSSETWPWPKQTISLLLVDARLHNTTSKRYIRIKFSRVVLDVEIITMCYDMNAIIRFKPTCIIDLTTRSPIHLSRENLIVLDLDIFSDQSADLWVQKKSKHLNTCCTREACAWIWTLSMSRSA